MSNLFDARPCSRTNKRTFIVAVGALIIGLHNNISQAADIISLPIALNRAIENNPGLKVFTFRQQGLNAQKVNAKLKPGYQLNIEAENIAGSDTFSGTEKAEFTVSLSSAIELGHKRKAREELANSGLVLLQAQRELDALTLLGDVTRAYIDVLASQERIKLAKSSLELSRSTLQEVHKRVKAGATPAAEVKRAQAKAAQAKLRLLSEQQQFSYAKTKLSALWGQAEFNFTSVSGNLYQYESDRTFSELYNALLTNPAVRILANESRVKEAALRLAKTQSQMDLHWSIGLRQFQETDDTALTAGLTLPLFNSRRNDGAIAHAAASYEESQAEGGAALVKLHTQLYRAYYNRQQAIISVQHLQADIIPSLQEALRQTQKAYQRGRYSYLDYVSANQELVSAQRSLIEAGAAALRYGAEIEQLTAQSLAASLANYTQE